MSDKKLELIAQLLAKAESTTPEEAEALTEHAERLMIKYGIDQARIDAKRAKAGQATEDIVQRKMTFTGTYRREMINLGAAVCRGLGSLRVLQARNPDRSVSLYIIGYESDVQQAETLILSLQVQSAVAVRAFWSGVSRNYAGYASYDQKSVRRSFVMGFGNGAGKRIADSRQQVIAEAGTGTELVLVGRDAKVQEFFDGMAKGKARRSNRKGSSFAASEGFAAGQQANTGERGVTQGRGITA
ncbi:hypothetical protein SEA_KAUALA_50 [Microbacterium phage Kauala]|nr:hypothetical protein SEA_KAUALA_50 [Microbacterium phage Kauala]